MAFENKFNPATSNVGRRKFLKGMAALAGITAVPGLLAACGDPTVTTAPAAAPTTAAPTTAAATTTKAATAVAPTTAASTTTAASATTAAASGAAPAGFNALGLVSSFKADGDPVAFTASNKKGFVYNKAGQFYVFSNVCTHQGCEVPYQAAQSKFVCPCHDSQFDKTGEVLKGPAAKRLPQYDFQVVGDTLYGKVGG